MLSIKEVEKVVASVTDGVHLTKVKRGYGDKKMRIIGVDDLPKKDIIDSLFELDSSLSRQCGMGVSKVTVNETERQVIVTYEFAPVLAFYKSFKQEYTIVK